MVGRVLIYLMKSGIWNFVLNFHETLGNPAQKFRSILVGKPCGLLTQHRYRRYRLSHFQDKVSPLPYPSLTSCIFLISHGCVLFVRLGDWAERRQGRNDSKQKNREIKLKAYLPIFLSYLTYCIHPVYQVLIGRHFVVLHIGCGDRVK